MLPELNILWYCEGRICLSAGNVWRVTPDSSSLHVTAQDWPYRDLDTPLTGVLCRDETLPGVRPGILLIHGGAGLDEHAREQARRYAALGYIVLACDMFGDGIAGNRDRVIRCLTTLRDDPPLMIRRAQAGLAALARCPGTDGRVAAIGFCFGGLAVLTLARSGEPVAGSASTGASPPAGERNPARSAPGCSSAMALWTRTCRSAMSRRSPRR
jgi:dienelactone hydrolase